MGSMTEFFGNLTDALLADRRNGSAVKHFKTDGEILLHRLLVPFLPTSFRSGQGSIIDIKDRQAGPFDIVGCWDAYPGLGEGPATSYVGDGVAFCLQVRNWAHDDLTHFGELAAGVKKLELRRKSSIACFAVSFDLLSLNDVLEFLKSSGGSSVDGVLSIGHHIVIRNHDGLYGDAARIPFVTEGSGPEALKAFSLLLLQLSQRLAGVSFGMFDYQHL